MSEELPKRLFKEGEETQVTQINNNCRLVYILEKLEEWLPKELRDVKKDPVFSQIFKLHDNGLGYSARVIHSLLCRELVTYKMHELWFVFARRPLRFSLQEFDAVTGLECNTSISLKEFDEWDDDGGFWSKVLKKKEGISILTLRKKHREAVKKWSNADRRRLVYLCIIVCVVVARDEKANIPLKYIKVVMNLAKLRKYPWGVAAFDLLLESVAKNRHKLKEKTTSYVLDGFSYALQIWAMEAIPKIGKLLGKKIDKGDNVIPRCINWMGAAKVSYEEIIQLENIIAQKDLIYPYISREGPMVVFEDGDFFRQDEVADDRVKRINLLIRNKHDFSDHIWEFEDTPEVSLELHDKEGDNDASAENDAEAENDDDFQTPKGSENIGSTSKKRKKRLPDRGMEKRKHKVLSGRPQQQSPFNEDMKAFVAQLFEQNFSAMEERLGKQMAEKFEKMEAELKESFMDGRVGKEQGQPSTSMPSPPKPSPPKPSPATKGGDAFERQFDINFSQAEDINHGIGTQGLEGLSQATYVPDFDPSQTNKDDEPRDWWTPMTSVRTPKVEPKEGSTAPTSMWEKWSKGQFKKLELSDSPIAQDDSPESSLYYVSEETWNRFMEWSLNPRTLKIGPIAFNKTVASRIIVAGKWLGNEEMDACMYIWREMTSLRRWTPNRVAFMSAMFCLQMESAYQKFVVNKKGYELPDFLLAYGRGELPSHGRTGKVWGVDVDRLYFPLFVNGNHWIAVMVNIIEKRVDVFDCFRGRNRQYVEKFAVMIPRIVKAVATPENKKHLLLSAYSIHEVPMKSRLNKSCADCGVYALKHLECQLLGLDINLVDDEIIMGCRQKIAVDLWEAAQDPILVKLMEQYVPSEFETSEVYDIAED